MDGMILDGTPAEPLPVSIDAPAAGAVALTRRHVALSGGRSIAYAEAGEGPVIVLIHGTLMTLEDMWLALQPILSQRYRVIALDRPGHGLSARRRQVDASPWRQAAIIHEALQALGLERPLLVGHSFGATIALCHALAEPEATAGVVALAPLCFPEPRLEQALFGPRGMPFLGEWLSPLLAQTLDPLMLPLLWRGIFLPQAIPETFRAFPAALASGSERMIAEGEDSLQVAPGLMRAAAAYATCRVPVRILGGTADLVVNNAFHGRSAAALMPLARFDWVQGAGHMLHHVRPDAVVAAIDG